MRFDSWTHPDHIELVVEAPLSKVIGSIGIPHNYEFNCVSCGLSCCTSCCGSCCKSKSCCDSCCGSCCESFCGSCCGSCCKSCSFECHCCGGNETQFFIIETNKIKYTVVKEINYCCCPPEIKTYKVLIN